MAVASVIYEKQLVGKVVLFGTPAEGLSPRSIFSSDQVVTVSFHVRL